eukprot:s1914_g5.t2
MRRKDRADAAFAATFTQKATMSHGAMTVRFFCSHLNRSAARDLSVISGLRPTWAGAARKAGMETAAVGEKAGHARPSIERGHCQKKLPRLGSKVSPMSEKLVVVTVEEFEGLKTQLQAAERARREAEATTKLAVATAKQAQELYTAMAAQCSSALAALTAQLQAAKAQLAAQAGLACKEQAIKTTARCRPLKRCEAIEFLFV